MILLLGLHCSPIINSLDIDYGFVAAPPHNLVAAESLLRREVPVPVLVPVRGRREEGRPKTRAELLPPWDHEIVGHHG
jgi:hypothetical protein